MRYIKLLPGLLASSTILALGAAIPAAALAQSTTSGEAVQSDDQVPDTAIGQDVDRC